MQTVYDAAGKAYELEPVDAREYVASGHYFNTKPKGKAAAEPVESQPAELDQLERPHGKPGPKPKARE
jgi:hypothetical protein